MEGYWLTCIGHRTVYSSTWRLSGKGTATLIRGSPSNIWNCLGIMRTKPAGKGLWGDAVRIVNPQVDERSGSTRQIETIVYVTRTSKKYHRDGCRYLKSWRSIKLADAGRLYQACRVCKPPQ